MGVAAALLLAACGGQAPDGEGGAGAGEAPGVDRAAEAPAGRALERPAWTVQHRDSAALWVGLDALDSLTVWVAGHGGRVARTVDGGASWSVTRVAEEDVGLRDVHAFSAHEAVVLSIGEGEASRIYRTEDGGATWTETFRNRDPDAFFDCLDFWDDGRGLAFSDAVGGEFVLMRTDDRGRSWSRVDPDRVPDARPGGEGSFAASGTCLVTAPDGRGWFGTGASGVDTRVVGTTDYGATWFEAVTPVPSNAPDAGLTSLAFFDGVRGVAFGGLALDSAVNVVVTEDGGRTWSPAARGVLDGTVYGSSTVPGAPTPTLVAVSPVGSAWSADFGRSWTRFDDREHWTVDFVHAGAGWAAGRGIISRVTRAP